MKSSWIWTVGVFIIGVGAGWVGGTYQQAKTTASVVPMFRAIDLDKVETRAKEAYAHQPRNVAIWEMRHLAEVLQEPITAQIVGPKTTRLQLFLVHARLARLYELETNQVKAREHFQEAVGSYNDDYPNAKIDSFPVMLDRLRKFDELAKIATPN